MGIVRAMLRNLSEGEMAQGASTITQQVARNFLLSNEKKLARKVREMILAGRIEETFDKDRILWLYLNQIYLGSRAYGVEAAARIYFDKHVEELTIAESALLAGLPQRPSDYSPHKAWDKARARQEYVLGQMLDKGFIDEATHQAALDEQVKIVKTENPTRVLAPTFTEEVRRHLVETYGEERVYNEGLIVHTTCDLKLQQIAQESVTKGVQYMDEQVGWRGPVEKLLDDAAIKARLKQQEVAMRDLDQHLADNARRGPLPERSSLRVGDRFEAVVLEVEAKHAKIGIGAHEALTARGGLVDEAGGLEDGDVLLDGRERHVVVDGEAAHRDVAGQRAPQDVPAGAVGEGAEQEIELVVGGHDVQPSGCMFTRGRRIPQPLARGSPAHADESAIAGRPTGRRGG